MKRGNWGGIILQSAKKKCPQKIMEDNLTLTLVQKLFVPFPLSLQQEALEIILKKESWEIRGGA